MVYNHNNWHLLKGRNYIGFLLLVAGVFAIISPYYLSIGISSIRATWIGIVISTIGTLVVSAFEGVLFDFQQKRFKEYFTIIGIKFGTWAPISNVSNGRLHTKNRYVENIRNGISPTLSGHITEIFITLYDDEIVMHKLKFTNKNEAVRLAGLFANNLNIEIIIELDD